MKWILSAAVLVAVALCARAAAPPLIKVCEPNASWKDGCNDCVCTADGQTACTARPCATTARPHGGCVPGTTWRRACNTCRCGSTGVGVCTQMACLGGDGGDDRTTAAPPSPGEERCSEGAVWKQACNTCRCVGGHAACTMMLCLGRRDTEAVQAVQAVADAVVAELPVQRPCTLGEVWKEDCNRCRCGPQGRAACTKMRCRPKHQHQVEATTEASQE